MTQDTAAPTGPADSYAPRRRSGPVGVGLIGTGMISDTYLEHLTSFPDVRVVILGNGPPHAHRPRPASTVSPNGAAARTC